MSVLQELYQTVESRKTERREGSHTCYLLEKGSDEILKKCGEECSEVIIAAKNGDNKEAVLELSDLLYCLTVLMVNGGISWQDVEDELSKRELKTGDLKQFHQVDKNTWLFCLLLLIDDRLVVLIVYFVKEWIFPWGPPALEFC